MMQVTDKRAVVQATVTLDKADVPQVEGFELDTEAWAKYVGNMLSDSPRYERGYRFDVRVVMGDAYAARIMNPLSLGRAVRADTPTALHPRLWNGMRSLAEDYTSGEWVWKRSEA